MVADVQNAPQIPRTPTLVERYGCYLKEAPLCTRKEMCLKNPQQCRIMNKTAGTCFLRNTAPNRLAKVSHAPLMESPDAHPVTFVRNSPKRRSSFYTPSWGNEYMEKTFQMVSILGCGSFGVVMRMQNRASGVESAIKYSMKYNSQHDRYEKWREVVFLEFINHPNCIKFRSSWEEADTLYIETELCLCNLQKYIFNRDGDVPEDKVWDVLLDVLRALAYLHKNSILHLDVKPENILLTSDGIAKLGDFGIAFHLGIDDPESCLVEGDSRYLAHEALNDASEFRVSTKRDIYSLGLCVLQLATDLWVPNNAEQLRQIRKFELPGNVVSRLSKELSWLIFKMMSHNPKERPEAQEILSDEHVQKRETARRKFVEERIYKNAGSGDVQSLQFDANWIKRAMEQARSKTITKIKSNHTGFRTQKRILF